MYLVGYLYEDYHDARLLEYKIGQMCFSYIYERAHNFEEKEGGCFYWLSFLQWRSK